MNQSDWQDLRTEYAVHANTVCPDHGEHSLSGTGTIKRHIEPLIKDLVEDIRFYYPCATGKVEGIYTGSTVVKKRIVNGKTEIKFVPLERTSKVYITRGPVKL